MATIRMFINIYYKKYSELRNMYVDLGEKKKPLKYTWIGGTRVYMIFASIFTPFQPAEAGQPGSPNGLPGKPGWPVSDGGFMLQSFDWRRIDPGWRPKQIWQPTLVRVNGPLEEALQIRHLIPVLFVRCFWLVSCQFTGCNIYKIKFTLTGCPREPRIPGGPGNPGLPCK